MTAKIFDEIVLAVISSAIFGSIAFLAVDLQGSFVVFWAVYCGNLLAGVAIAYVIAAIARDLDTANAMLPAYASTLVLFAGFMIRLDDIPNYYYWYTYLNFVQYGFSALLVNQYDTEKAANLTLRVPREKGGFENVMMLEYYSINDVNASVYASIIYVFVVVYCLLAYLAMQYWRHQKR